MLHRFLILLLTAIALAAVWKALPGSTPAIRTGPAPIAVLESVEIGGMRQWLLIRGQDRTAPVLLWLHGGPGAAQMPMAHATTRSLESDFVVVHWDQRGAGKSNPRDFDAASMTFERFLRDAHQVTQHLQERLGVDQIMVLGHSWGTMLGTRLVARWPDHYSAYIGVAQQVSTARGIEVTLQRLAPMIHTAGQDKHLRWLETTTPKALMEHAAYVEMMQMLDDYEGGMNVPVWRLALMLFRSPEYSLADIRRWLDGANRGSGTMWPDYRSRDLAKEISVMPVPMLLISGAQDLNTPAELAASWFDQVSAPQGKQHLIFKDSGHAPFLTEPEAFTKALQKFAETFGGERETSR